jgi:hypothetical protein
VCVGATAVCQGALPSATKIGAPKSASDSFRLARARSERLLAMGSWTLRGRALGA